MENLKIHTHKNLPNLLLMKESKTLKTGSKITKRYQISIHKTIIAKQFEPRYLT